MKYKNNIKMLAEISQHLKEKIKNFPDNDVMVFDNKIINVAKNNFKEIKKNGKGRTIAFLDGGQAEILSAGNFCLGFIRIFAVVFKENQKVKDYKNEFYILTTAKYLNDDVFYESKIFGDKLIDDNDLFISSNDSTIKTGSERAPMAKVTNVARRFSELALAKKINADFIILDGTLEKTFLNEDRYLNPLSAKVSALAKSSSLFTTSGNSPVILLNKIGPAGCWSYTVNEKTAFTKLHPHAKHIFRFEGNKEVLPFLQENSTDAIFLGYPYGLILADRLARVSNREKKSLMMKLMLRKENKQITEYLQAMNAHNILDSIN